MRNGYFKSFHFVGTYFSEIDLDSNVIITVLRENDWKTADQDKNLPVLSNIIRKGLNIISKT